MPITYTNRKDITYTLCRGTTKTGKPRYFFAREPKGEVVEEIPEGREIRESVNGIVSLVKIRPEKIQRDEKIAVEQALRRHPKSRHYRFDTRQDRIMVYELVGPDADEIIEHMAPFTQSFMRDALAERFRADQERYGQWTPVMRFILEDEEDRKFTVERMMYRGFEDKWWGFGGGRIGELTRRYIPKLGTDEFFELI